MSPEFLRGEEMKNTHIVVIVFCVLVSLAFRGGVTPVVVVKDEDGIAVQEAIVKVNVKNSGLFGTSEWGWGSGKQTIVEHKTDKDGKARIRERGMASLTFMSRKRVIIPAGDMRFPTAIPNKWNNFPRIQRSQSC